jgi:hypothetical protein
MSRVREAEAVAAVAAQREKDADEQLGGLQVWVLVLL